VTPSNACLDAETLAAWVDGGLSRHDAALAEAHVSSCPRCQAIAGLIVKTTPATAAAAPWWRARAPWLIPITAGVAAAGLLMIAPADSPTPGAPTPSPPAATAKLESAARAAEPVAPPVTAPAETRKEKQRETKNTAADAAKADAAAPAAAPAPAAPAPPALARPDAAPPAAVSARVADEQAARQGFAATAAKDAVSPDRAFHWRITDRGTLERSTDGGTTWRTVNVGVAATFTTVEAPEPRTAIVTTTDGRRFRSTDAGATWLPVQD
jgi:hypothetical protein